MAQVKDIYLSEYIPDRGGMPFPQDSGYLVQAENVRPTAHGYRTAEIDELTDASNAAVAATPVGAAAFSVATNARHYAGSASALYESDDEGLTWNTNSRSSPAYSTATSWDFELFEDHVIAVNGFDEPQFKLITDADTTDFADLTGGPPIAARIARVRDHVVLGRLSTNAFAVQWSSIGNPTGWPTPGNPTSLSTQAGLQELPRELGLVTQIVGGEKFGLVFQQSGITRMTYIGGNVVYQFDTLERSHGTGFIKGAVRVGAFVYYMSSLGVFRTDGHTVQNLSISRVEDSIIRALTSFPDAATAYGQSGVYDPRTDTVSWSFQISGSPYLLNYHISYERFTLTNLAGTLIGSTLHSVRSVASEEAQRVVPYAFNTDKKLISFTDTTGVAAALQSGYIELHPGRLTQVVGIQILGLEQSGSVGLLVKSKIDITDVDAVQSGFTSTSAGNRSDIYRVRSMGRYHAFRWTDTVDGSALFRGLRIHYELGPRI